MTEQRKYSVDEIDDMRRSIKRAYPTGISYNRANRMAEIEDRLRTHMVNGTDPEELSKAADLAEEEDWQRNGVTFA